MTWIYEHHKTDYPEPGEVSEWWEVRNAASPFPNYFIVEYVGDPDDGQRLASLLNEREQLLIDNQDMKKLFDEVQKFLTDDLGTVFQLYDVELVYQIDSNGGNPDDQQDIDELLNVDDKEALRLYFKDRDFLMDAYDTRRKLLERLLACWREQNERSP